MEYEQFGLRDGRFIPTAVYGDGGIFVIEEGIWQSFDVQCLLFDHGKLLVLWKKTSKGLKMFRGFFSSNRPGNNGKRLFVTTGIGKFKIL